MSVGVVNRCAHWRFACLSEIDRIGRRARKKSKRRGKRLIGVKEIEKRAGGSWGSRGLVYATSHNLPLIMTFTP